MGLLGNLNFLMHGSQHFSRQAYVQAAKSFDNGWVHRAAPAGTYLHRS